MFRSVVLITLVGTSLSSWGLPVNSSLNADAGIVATEKVADESLLDALNPVALLQKLTAALTAADSATTEEEYETAVREAMDNATPEDMKALFDIPDEVAQGEEAPSSDLIEKAAYSGGVLIRVSIASQSLVATYPGGQFGPVAISSARKGYHTARGTYSRLYLKRMHYSRKYHMSPMPHSIFYNGGYAIHGTNAVGSLGRPASHGCVRLSPANAATLYSIVQRFNGATLVVR